MTNEIISGEHNPVKVGNTDIEVCDTCKTEAGVPALWDVVHPVVVEAEVIDEGDIPNGNIV